MKTLATSSMRRMAAMTMLMNIFPFATQTQPPFPKLMLLSLQKSQAIVRISTHDFKEDIFELCFLAIDALIVGIETQAEYLASKKTWTRKIVIVTDGESPIEIEDWEATVNKM